MKDKYFVTNVLGFQITLLTLICGFHKQKRQWIRRGDSWSCIFSSNSWDNFRKGPQDTPHIGIVLPNVYKDVIQKMVYHCNTPDCTILQGP